MLQSTREKRYKDNAEFVKKILLLIEQGASETPWSNIDKSKLPASCFLWVEDLTKKSTWHLPYREGSGGIDPDTKMYRKAGAVNMNALRAVSAAIEGARTGKPMSIPSEVRGKIERLLKKHKIGKYAEKKEMLYQNGMTEDEKLNEMKHKLLDVSDYIDSSYSSLSEEMKAKAESIKQVIADFLKMLLSPAQEGLKESYSIDGVALLEYSASELTTATHDTDNGIIKNIAIIRDTSKNCSYREGKGRKYSNNALNNIAEMINGKKMYKDHQRKSEKTDLDGVRSIDALIGVFENGRVDKGIVRADLKYLKTQKDFIEAILSLNAPGVGTSIDALGKSTYNQKDRTEIIESITALRSADLVSEAGSTSSLFESFSNNVNNQSKEDGMGINYAEINLSDLVKARPDIMDAMRIQVEEGFKDETKLDTLIKENAELKDKLDKVNKTLDEFKVKESLANRATEIEKELESAKLPKEALTEIFRESLMKEDNADIRKKMIEDRKTVVTESLKIKGMGTERIIKEGDKAFDDAYRKSCSVLGVKEAANGK